MIKNLIFYIGMGTFFTHELDAVQQYEWRVLPLTGWLPDEYGFMVFLLFHILLFAVLIALIASANERIRLRAKVGIGIFLIVHALLHLFYSWETLVMSLPVCHQTS